MWKLKVKFYRDPTVRRYYYGKEQPRHGDAGFDLCSAKNRIISAGTRYALSTGVYVGIPTGWVGIIKDRSSMAVKGLYVQAGVIDSGYRGELIIVLQNTSSEDHEIDAGQKIAQIIFLPHIEEGMEVSSVEDLGITERQNSGFGSTGK
jgi:dUTP pyrophosphatase